MGVLASAASFVVAVVLFFAMLGQPDTGRTVTQHLYDWIAVGTFRVPFDLRLDQLSISFVLLITFVGTLIHVYSMGYMEHDPERRRFFGYLNLFVASMLLLVLADNYLLLYVGWEGVGLASYLLIGFWLAKDSAAVAAKKAFIVNRVGDVGLSLAVMLMFVTFGTGRLLRRLRRSAGRPASRPTRGSGSPAARRLRQVGAVPAAVLAARRDGGPHPGLGAHPRRHDGHRRRLPDRPLARRSSTRRRPRARR